MRHGFVIALVATLFVACNNDKKDKDATTTTDNTGTTTTNTTINNTATGWPDSTRSAFITDCINNSKGKMSEENAREVCDCMLAKIESQYPNYANAASLTMQQINDMAKECVK